MGTPALGYTFEPFATLDIAGLASIGLLTSKICRRFERWGCDAAQVHLHLVPRSRAKGLERGGDVGVDLLQGEALWCGDTLEEAGVVEGEEVFECRT
jgi:hypothetical protein